MCTEAANMAFAAFAGATSDLPQHGGAVSTVASPRMLNIQENVL